MWDSQKPAVLSGVGNNNCILGGDHNGEVVHRMMLSEDHFNSGYFVYAKQT